MVSGLRVGYRVPFQDSSSPLSLSGIVSDMPGGLGSYSSLAALGRDDALQACPIESPRSGSRPLQSPLPGGDGGWGVENRDRPLSSERVRPFYSVQDRHSHFCAVIFQREGFSSFRGSERLFLSDPDVSILPEAIRVYIARNDLPLSSPVLRSVDCSPGLHSGVRSHVRMRSRSWNSSSEVSGRLVGSRFLEA